MAASTITRTTWTNDTGTPTTPVGDGTLLNNARLQDIYAAIDQMFSGAGSYATLTIGGKLAVEGFGTSSFDASGAGEQVLRVRNTSSGSSAMAKLSVGQDTSADAVTLRAYSSTFTGSSSQGQLVSSLSGGLYLVAGHASGVIYFNTAGTLRGAIDAAGRWGVGLTTPSFDLDVRSTVDGVSGGLRIGRADASYLIVNMDDGGASTAWATFQAGDSGGYRPLHLNPLGGTVRLADGSASAPVLSFISDTDTGFYKFASNEIGLAGNGVNMGSFQRGSQTSWWIQPSANGTGANTGNYLVLGRNSSGSGAAGYVVWQTRTSANSRITWVDDSGNFRIHTAAPSEDNTTVSDTAGTVVGTQTSLRSTKRAIADFLDHAGALDLIKRTPLYCFQYREFDPETRHVGIMADESPEFVRFGGTTFDPINAFGYTAAALKALIGRVESLEAALAAGRQG